MAKPIPWAPPMIAVLIPTTLPEASAFAPDRTPKGAHHPRRDAPLEPQRIADGDDELPDDEVPGLPECGRRGLLLGREAHHREVARRVVAEDLGRYRRPARERNLDAARAAPAAPGPPQAPHDVGVGDGGRRPVVRPEHYPAPAAPAVRKPDRDDSRFQLLGHLPDRPGI